MKGAGSSKEHDDMSTLTLEKAATIPGYLGYESAGSINEITISYWESLEAIKLWKNDMDHQVAKKKGREEWFKRYKVRICKVEREYLFENKSLI
ncbi:hypothetical protein HDV02_001288 [Globomyces sp. JEL0801]|nr:hypothetical protein HDV02_001288 [Globomyces sp. JEL0801]